MEADGKRATGSISNLHFQARSAGTGSDEIEPIIYFMGIVIDAA